MGAIPVTMNALWNCLLPTNAMNARTVEIIPVSAGVPRNSCGSKAFCLSGRENKDGPEKMWGMEQTMG